MKRPAAEEGNYVSYQLLFVLAYRAQVALGLQEPRHEVGKRDWHYLTPGLIRALKDRSLARHPDIRIIIAADNDRQTAGNPGMADAGVEADSEAARISYTSLIPEPREVSGAIRIPIIQQIAFFQ